MKHMTTAGVVLAIVAVAGMQSRGAVDTPHGGGADSLARLKAGNARFVSSPKDALPIDGQKRAALAAGQTPFAAVLSCADSRVPPEVVFHTGLGDLFVVRDAGNITDKAVLGSVEYAVEHLHVPLVVVMGHESCGAVKAAVETPAGQSLGPNLDFVIAAIHPAVVAAASAPANERMKVAILDHGEDSLNAMVTESAILREYGEQGKLMFVGAYYELSTGRVHFSDPVKLAPMAEGHKAGELR
jgi:carbonic anhydrase